MNINIEILLERKKIYPNAQDYPSEKQSWIERTNKTGEKLRELGMSLWRKSTCSDEIFNTLESIQRSVGYYIPGKNGYHWVRASNWYGIQFDNHVPSQSDPSKYYFTWPSDFSETGGGMNHDTVVLLSPQGVHWLNELGEAYLGRVNPNKRTEDVFSSGFLTLSREQQEQIRSIDTASVAKYGLPSEALEAWEKAIGSKLTYQTGVPKWIRDFYLFGNAYIKLEDE